MQQFYDSKGVGMTKEEIFFNVVIPLIAAIIGGGLTLVGVLLTIAWQKKINKKEELCKYKPYLKVTNQKAIEIIDSEFIKGIQCDDEKYLPIVLKKGAVGFRINDFNIKNTSNADTVLKYIIINDAQYDFQNIGVFERGTCVAVSTTRNYIVNSLEGARLIKLVAEDMLGNMYSYNCQFDSNWSTSHIENNLLNEKGKFDLFPVTYIIKSIGLPQRLN